MRQRVKAHVAEGIVEERGEMEGGAAKNCTVRCRGVMQLFGGEHANKAGVGLVPERGRESMRA